MSADRPEASPDDIRRALRDVLAHVAPEATLEALRPDQPLRDQIDLDSMDWVNVAAALESRLGVALDELSLPPRVTLDELVEQLGAAMRRGPAAGQPVPAVRQHRLSGVDVTLRPIRPDDAAMEAAFVRQLSDQSRYQRFMGTVRELPEAKLRELTDVDGVRHVALVATATIDRQETELGVARYVVDDSGRRCEFAIAVADAWQGSGLAGLLMGRLVEIARARGLEVMDGSVLATNTAMLHFARQLGFEVHADADDPTTRRVTRRL
ncbi:MAG: GNAT family N-acetyltransferase [Piscinibacter sp.]|uniref:GNAT family N-acetyltransferase n=1 Tax=Piscinibacter sp. TaxID=1903157 RepID=UPI003D0C4DBF